jgi:hypothetical protein
VVLSTITGAGIAARRVIIGGQTGSTADDGSFSIENVSSKYDAVVADPEGANVSVYYGLARRDPILWYSPGNTLRDQPLPKGYISGVISGAFAFPLGSGQLIRIYFVSSKTVQSSWELGENVLRFGPNYGPIPIAWSGADPVDGRVIGLGRVYSQGGLYLSGALASQPVTVSANSTVEADLVLSSVPNGHLAGSIQTFKGLGDIVFITYRLPTMLDFLTVGAFRASAVFDYEVPDLSALGGTYCLNAASSEGRASTNQCGIEIGARNVALTVPAPPEIVKPTTGSPVTKDTRFSWTSIGGAVYVLELSARASGPDIAVYTTATEVSWPDLSAMGIAFPAGTEYGCQVTAVLPHGTVDEAGLGIQDEGQRLTSEMITVTPVK